MYTLRYLILQDETFTWLYLLSLVSQDIVFI